MTGLDWMVVAGLLSFIGLVILFDRLKALDQQRNEQPCRCWMCATTREHRTAREREEREAS
jgi:hypothetical protein